MVCSRIITQAEEDELVHHIVKTTHESLLELVSLRRRVSRYNIEGDILGNSSKDAPDVPLRASVLVAVSTWVT